MANMAQHTVKLISYDKDNMIAVITIDSDPTQYSVSIPRYDPSFLSSPPSNTDAIAWIKNFASKKIDSETGLPDLTSLVGGTL